MFQFNCDVCGTGATLEERRNCPSCSPILILFGGLFFPADITNGSFDNNHASVPMVFDCFKLGLTAATNGNFVTDQQLSQRMLDKFNNDFGFGVVSTRQLAHSVLPGVYPLLVRNLFSGLMSRVQETVVDLFGVDSDAKVASVINVGINTLNDVAREMCFRGKRIVYGYFNVNDVVDDKFLNDNDITFRERPLHYRLIKVAGDFGFFILLATENHSRMQREMVAIAPQINTVQQLHLDQLHVTDNVVVIDKIISDNDLDQSPVNSDYDPNDGDINIGGRSIVGPGDIRHVEYDNQHDNGPSQTTSYSVRDRLKLIIAPDVTGPDKLSNLVDYDSIQKLKFVDRSNFNDLTYLSGHIFVTCDHDVASHVIRKYRFFDMRGYHVVNGVFDTGGNIPPGYAVTRYRNVIKRTNAILNWIEGDKQRIGTLANRLGADGYCYKVLFNNHYNFRDTARILDIREVLSIIDSTDKSLLNLHSRFNLSFHYHDNGNVFHIREMEDGYDFDQIIAVLTALI